MNKFVTSALALAALSSVGFAGPGEDSEWLELDSEINSLASAVTAQGPIGGWAVLIAGNYAFTSEKTSANPDHTSGFTMTDARVSTWGEVGDYGWRLSMNAGPFDTSGGGTFTVEDAYVHWRCGDYFNTQMGSFRPHTFRSAYVWEENQLFISRSFIGNQFDFFDVGIGANGEWEDFRWNWDVLNGSNGANSKHIWLNRIEWDLNGGVGQYIGAYGSSDDLALTAGITSIHPDVEAGNSSVYGVDVYGSIDQIGFGAELAYFDNDFEGTSQGLNYGTSSNDFLTIDGNATAYMLMASYLVNQEFEAGVRFQDPDEDDTQAYTFGVSWYQNGKNAKWLAEWTIIDSNTDVDGSVFQIGLSLGSST